jgi:hypothetical protein
VIDKAQFLNLLICGAMRSGTTSLKAYLSEHPEIAFVDGNDIHIPGELSGYYPFASPSLAQAQLGDDPQVYAGFCHKLAGRVAYIADKRAYFMFFPQIPFNLREQLPKIRLIFILRNPIEIVYSAFWQEKHANGDPRTFEAYLQDSLDTVRQAASSFQRDAWLEQYRPGSALPNLVERGLYYTQLIRFYRLFSSEQILVLRYDHLCTQPQWVMADILNFLNLDADFAFEGLHQVHNAAPPRLELLDTTRVWLQEIFSLSNRRVLALLGWPADLWD